MSVTQVTRTLARFVVESKFDALPEPVRHEGERAFVNWLGCVLGACRETVVERALATMLEFAGPPQATVIGWGTRVDAPTAALLNTMSDFVHSYNDTHLATVAHPNGPPASAAFALAERQKLSGPEVLHALILGTEIACRLANVLAAPPANCHVGLSTHGVTNVVGAAVAIGKLLRLNEEQMVWAIGLAVTQAAGIRSAHASMASKLIGGHAARSGMIAAYLAAKGFTCGDDSIEGPKGFGAVFANPANAPAAIDRLGEHYEMMNNAYKPYPCGIVNHAPIDACLKVAEEPGFDADSVDHVELRVHPLVEQLCDRPNAQDRMQAIVSVQHWAAVSLLYRVAGLQQGSDRCVREPAVVAMRRRVSMTSDPAMASVAAAVTLVMKDGRKLTAHVDHCRGSLERPMSDRDLDVKFRGQAARVLPDAKVEELLAQCWKIRQSDDVGALAQRFFQSELPPR
jgi:2-methylcitrate dehydratase PrpD